MKPKARWHLWHWKKYQKISCTQMITSLSDGPLRSGTVPLRVWRSSVLSSVSQSSHWNPGLVPVQWRVNTGQADWRDGGGREGALHRLWLKITRWSRATCWRGLQSGTTGWGDLLWSPGLPYLQPKPTEQLVMKQECLPTQKKKTCTLLCYPSKIPDKSS